MNRSCAGGWQVNVRDIECAGGVSLWAWPEGVSLSQSRRHLCSDEVMEHYTVQNFDKCNHHEYPEEVTDALDDESTGCMDIFVERCSSATTYSQGGSCRRRRGRALYDEMC